jgi:TonB family protein
MPFLTRKQTTGCVAKGHAAFSTSTARPRRQAVAAALAILLHGAASAAATTTPDSAPNLPDASAAKKVGDVSCQLPESLYPAHAKMMGLEGTAILDITIGTGGQVEQAKVRTSTGIAELDAAAIATIMQAHCKLHLENGHPIRVSTMVPIPFYLERGRLKTI